RTASTMAGTSTESDTVPRTWPPASTPCATIASTPASAHAAASSTEPTCGITLIPRRCASRTRAPGFPQCVESTATCSSRGTSMPRVAQSGVASMMRLRGTLHRRDEPNHGISIPRRTALDGRVYLAMVAEHGPLVGTIRTYDGAVVLITGGASGIGAALSRQLAARG